MPAIHLNGTDQYAYADFVGHNNFPITLAAWCYMQTTPASLGVIMSVCRIASSPSWYAIHVGSAGTVSAQANGGGIANTSTTTETVPIGTWFHACGVFLSNVSRTAYLDGRPATPETTNRTPATIARTTIGARWSPSSFSNFFPGLIAYPAVWNVALSDGEVASLAAGSDPRLVRRGNLQDLYFSNENYGSRSVNRSNVLTPIGSPGWTPGPPHIWGPFRDVDFLTRAATALATTLSGAATPVFMHHRQQQGAA